LLGDRIQGEHGQVLEQPNDGDHPEKVGNEPSACRSARLPATYGSGRIASLQGDAAGSLRKVARLSDTSAMKAPIGLAAARTSASVRLIFEPSGKAQAE